jgi:hypothetical protein
VGVVEDDQDLAAGLEIAEHLDQGTPNTQRFDIGGSFGSEPGQPFRWWLARLCQELVYHAVGKACLKLRPADPQHTVVPYSGEERVEQRGLPNSLCTFEQYRP